MIKKVLLSLLFIITSTQICADDLRVHVDVDNKDVEFFYDIEPLGKYYHIDEISNNLLTYLQDESRSSYNFQTESLKEVKLKDKKRIFVVESPPTHNYPRRTLVVFILDNEYSYTVKCTGPEKEVSLTSGQCAELIYKSAKLTLNKQDVENAINRTPNKS